MIGGTVTEDSNFTDAPRGYLSAASKRRFTLTAGILGAAFLLGQFLLPFALMAWFMASGSHSFEVDFARRNPKYFTVWDDGFFFVETEASFGDEQKPSTLVRTHLEDTADTEPKASLEGTPYLLAGNDRLWLIAKNTFGYFQKDKYVHINQPKMLAEISQPFLFEGRPAVLERWPNELALVVYDGEVWNPTANLPIVMPEPDCGCGLHWAKAVADEKGVHLFLEFGSSLYYGLWDPYLSSEPQWELAAETGEDWSPVLWRGEPAVLGVTSRNDGGRLVGTRRGSEGWKEFLSHGKHNSDLVTAFATSGSDSLIALIGTSYSSSVKVLEITDGSVHRESWIGEQPTEFDRFPSFMIVIMAAQYGGTILFPILLAVILSALMRRHRVDRFHSGEQEINQASLNRRALAQLVDLVISVGPVVAAIGLFMRAAWSGVVDEPEEFREAVVVFWPVLSAMAWGLLASLFFTFSEGRWGITPGKWLTGIRVLGTDLQPCGFGRALVRNLLKCIDGFFNFVVGIMVVALSENWQRVGDMAARTVVVRNSSR
ncbi:MAG: RDD family protein [bacterium]|nr:RDD family protein [bacterium]